jgi:hypothetical protein
MVDAGRGVAVVGGVEFAGAAPAELGLVAAIMWGDGSRVLPTNVTATATPITASERAPPRAARRAPLMCLVPATVKSMSS